MIASRPDDDAVVALRYKPARCWRPLSLAMTVRVHSCGTMVRMARSKSAFRQAIGQGWVSEVAVGPDVPIPLIKRLVPLAYQSGRALRLVGVHSIGELPPPSPTPALDL